ncbi:MAG: corrinoid protein [Candidatus Marinimicrobia bacterium]|nr:corrinoid protein [Candidatus Neomarinimicrobiota bacterium]
MSIMEELKNAVIKGHLDADAPYPPDMVGQPGVKDLIEKALEEDIELKTILNEGLIGGMNIVGEKFSSGEYFVPEMMISAKAMKGGLNMLEPLLVKEPSQKVGTVIMGTVQGDMHDIGKNLVGMMLEGGGFEVIDLGVDVDPEKFIENAKENPDAIIGMSALLTTTMENMRKTIKLIRSEGLDNKIIIGGAPITKKFADDIGAEGQSNNAGEVVGLVKNLLKSEKQ